MINEKELQKKIGWSPFPEQQEVLQNPEREVVLCAGRRFGKSALCAYKVLTALLTREKEISEWYKTKQGPRPKPIKIWVVSLTYDLTQKVFEYLTVWYLNAVPTQKQGISSRPYPQIKAPFGSWVQCKSAENPHTLLGEELDLLIVDEAARFPRHVYETYLYPATSSRQGQTVFISTPFGQNWFYERFMINSGYRFESRVNPHFPEEEWENARKVLPEQVFNQEYRASFLPDAAAVFRGVDEIIKDDVLEEPLPGKWYVMGVDIAKHEDFTVVTVVDRSTKKVVHFDRFNKIDYGFQKQRIKERARWYNNAKIIVDSSSVGEPIKDDLERDGMFVEDISFNRKNKRQIIEKLSIFIEQKYVYIPPIQILIDELKSFGYKLTDSGNVQYSAPQGMHDDCVISLGLAVWGLNSGPGEKEKTKVERIFEEKPEKRKINSKIYR